MYQKSAELGDDDAQYLMGNKYELGEGVSVNLEKAVEWHLKAAEQDYAEAQCHLGICYLNGEGVAFDKAKGMDWFKKAAQNGSARANEVLINLSGE